MKMRRTDREITDFNEIIDVLRRSDTIRLGLNSDPYPYIVPLSFGFEVLNDKISIYFHGAKEGLKHDLIAKNPHVCVEADIFHRYAETPQNSITTEYESFIGFGIAELTAGEEAIKGMDLLLEHCGYAGFEYDRKALDFTAIYRITLDSFTGKRRFL
jgi:nitroimidazol reductase NimA-like FMN-containing flavoprotein (pyridoxamine 5'-phosphate oxidase superfamily)